MDKQDKVLSNADVFLNDKGDAVYKHPIKLMKTKKVIMGCRVCRNKVIQFMHDNKPDELSKPDNYCDVCRKKLEVIWS